MEQVHFGKVRLENGDNEPSLSVKDDYITDFGGDFKGDIFQFVMRLKGISKKEALELLKKDFSLNIDISSEKANKQAKEKKSKKPTVIKKAKLVESNSAEEIWNMFDTVNFRKKPTGGQIGGIKQRIENLSFIPYSLQEIKDKIINGYTSIPAGIKTNKEWKDDKTEIQILMLDIDNSIKEGTKKENIFATDPRHITTEKIVEYSKSINLEPTFIYSTFSHTEKQNRLRMVYVLEKPVKNAETVKLIYEYLFETFKDFYLDESTSDISRMFLGGKDITYSSDKFYKIEIEEEKVKSTENEEISKYAEKLKSSPYFITDGILWKAGANSDSPVSNFLAIIDEQVNYNNGRDIITDYKLHGILLKDGRHLPKIRINKQELENFSFVLNSQWKLDAIISAGATNKDRMREITQLISKDDVINKNVYAHTGFVRIEDKLVYLYHRWICRRCERH